MKEYTWATIVPLVGGLPLAMQEATGRPPEYVMSYPGFEGNDDFYMDYLVKKGHDVPYILLDKETTNNPLPEIIKHVDITCAIPPCAGLSMLNSQTGGAKGRGSEAEQNSCMYYTSEFVLHNVQPLAHIGESAPGLSSSIGEGVVKNLQAIAAFYGYRFHMIRTNSELHGLPQNRPRTFYIFWKEQIPKLQYIAKPMPHIRDFIDAVPESATHYTDYLTDDKPSDNLWYQFVLMDADLTHPQMMNTFQGSGTVLKYIVSKKKLDEAIEWITPRDRKIRPGGSTTYASTLRRMKEKMSRGLGYWDGSPIVYNDRVNAVISKNVFGWMHYEEDRYFSIRDLMSLMGLPDDFDIDIKRWNIICQNVPLPTARDWCNEIIETLNGNRKFYNGMDYVFMNNVEQKTYFETNQLDIFI